MDLETAQVFVNTLFIDQAGRQLRKPETVIIAGTWQGMTYEQMADSSAYSANYLMRDIAPKFWRLLSKLLGKNVGKTNFRVAINALYQDFSPATLQNSRFSSDTNKLTISESVPTLSSSFYGYSEETKTLQNWLEIKRYQLIGLWGLSGTGKTLLMKRFCQEIQKKFEVVIWRSLDKKPTLAELLKDILHREFNITQLEPSNLLSEFLVQLQSRPCLLLVDGLESILRTQVFSGKYLSGYEDYRDLWRIVIESSHQSCVVFTSLENPAKLIPRTYQNSSVGYLKLLGLNTKDAKSLLTVESIAAEATADLIDYYQGNPGILKTVAQIVRELFNGNITEFLAQKSLVFGEINQLINKSFTRLSTLEKEILYWLASQEHAVSLLEIEREIPLSIYPVELIEALESLKGRSLIATSQIEQRTVFVLSSMMREFITNQFVSQIGNSFSIINRQSSLSTNNTIELGKTSPQITNLSQWLQNHFEPGWQPIEVLFAASERSPARLRSAFNLRSDRTIKRFKQINLNTPEPTTVLLLIAITQEEEGIQICVQAQPEPAATVLPKNLHLNLQDNKDALLAEIVSEAEDNFIQLPYFRGTANEQFKIGLSLNSYSYQEDFVI